VKEKSLPALARNLATRTSIVCSIQRSLEEMASRLDQDSLRVIEIFKISRPGCKPRLDRAVWQRFERLSVTRAITCLLPCIELTAISDGHPIIENYVLARHAPRHRESKGHASCTGNIIETAGGSERQAANWKAFSRCLPSVVPVLFPTGATGVGSLKPVFAASTSFRITTVAAP
jgi:hypothetical protein